MLSVQYVHCVAGCLFVKTKQETQGVARQSSIAGYLCRRESGAKPDLLEE